VTVWFCLGGQSGGDDVLDVGGIGKREQRLAKTAERHEADADATTLLGATILSNDNARCKDRTAF
jgi:hypothetical protein